MIRHLTRTRWYPSSPLHSCQWPASTLRSPARILFDAMVVIRCTQKMLKRVGPPDREPQTSTTRLGDWSANLVGVGRQRFVLLVADRTRLPILLPARGLKSIRVPLVDALAHVLLSLNVAALSVRRELAEMRDGAFAPTNNRSVLGTMNDFSNATWCRYHDEPDADPLAVSLWLAETPMQPFRGKAADQLTRELFEQ